MDIPINDASDPRVAIFLGLRDHAARQRRERPGGDAHGSFIAEGDLVIERAVEHGFRLRSVLIGARRTKAAPASWRTAAVYRAGDDLLTEITGRPELRDPIAQFDRPEEIDFQTLVRSSSRFAVLENINNANNMGVIMRNAAALGIDAVLLDPTCSDPLYRRAIRASMGQVFAVRNARIPPLDQSLEMLHDQNVLTVALTPSGSTNLADVMVDPDRKVAVLLGAEGPGLSNSALAGARVQAHIAMSNDVDSLNVANAAAIAFYALRR